MSHPIKRLIIFILVFCVKAPGAIAQCFEYRGIVQYSDDLELKLLSDDQLMTFKFKENQSIRIPTRLFVRLRAFRDKQSLTYETDAKSIDMLRRNVASSYPSVKVVNNAMSKESCLVRMK